MSNEGHSLDDRLTRLVERHEALTQTVEHLALQSERILNALDKDAENIRALTRIAEIHERRISQLEGSEDI